jgi:hypothetical protein
MAKEAVLLVETHQPISMTCADNAGIEKGAILTLSGANTVISHDGTANASFAGIAAAEKIANDGNTHIPVYRGGIFKLTANAAVTLGAALALDAVANTVKDAVAANIASDILGVALESCNAQNDVIRCEIRPGFNNNAYA